MKLSKLFSLFSNLGSAVGKAGELHYVSPSSPPAGNLPYLTFGSGSQWVGMTPVHIGVKANLPAPASVPVGATAIVTDVNDHRGVAGAVFTNNGTAWKQDFDNGTYPVTNQPGMIFDNTSATTQLQAALDVAYTSTSLAGYDYGRGREISLPTGVIRTGPVQMSAYTGLIGQGNLGGTVLKFLHTGVTTPTAMITQRPDAGSQQSISPNPVFRGVILEGDKANATTTVHGYYAPERTDGEKEDCPIFQNTQIISFSGDGFRAEKNHRQIRAANFKSLAHNGWGLYLAHNSDSKMDQIGIGRSLQGQVYLEDCASPKFDQFDIWTPGGFQGLYMLQMMSSRNVQFNQGELEGRIYIEGDNSEDNPAGKTKFQVTNVIIDNFNLKVSQNTYEGVQYTGGGGTTLYDSMVHIRAQDAIKFVNGAIGYGQGQPNADYLAATPKYIWEFSVKSGRNYDVEAGYVEVANVDIIHQRKRTDGTAPIIPFTKHWGNDPARVIFRDGGAAGPGQPVMLNNAAVTINYVPADGRTLTTADYPLLYLGRDFALNWSSGSKPATFTVQDMSGVPVPNGMGWYVRIW